MNKVFLIGRIGKDPEFKTTQNGISVCSFSLAVNDKYNREKPAQWFNVICWRNTAEFAARYLCKGRKIAVEGSLQTRSYDAQDGSKRYVTEVIADNVEFCDSANGGGQAAPQRAERPAQDDGFTEVDDDELPF